MTCVVAFPTVARMFTEAQILYLEEVLGTSTEGFCTAGTASALAPPPAVAVVSAAQGADEKALLTRILGAIQQVSAQHFGSLEFVPEGVRHVLIFGGDAPGRHQRGEKISWELPALSAMLGTGMDVANAKKQAWSLLQQMQKENA